MKYNELVNWNTNKIKKERWDDYVEILNYSVNKKIEVISFKQALYNYINKLEKFPTCDCGEPLQFLDINRGYRKYCSNKCSGNNELTKEKRKNTVLSIYSVENVSNDKTVIEKKRQTNLKKLGVEFPMQSKIVQEKKKLNLKNKFLYNQLIDEFNSNIENLNYRKVLIKKESFQNFLNNNSKEELKPFLKVLLVLIRHNLKKFIFPDNETSLDKIYKLISKIEITDVLENKTFKNYGSSTGTIYLKSILHSFYHSSFNGGETPYEIFFNDKKLLRILKYRIGINDSNEVYNLSMHTIIKGISAIRGTVSFFKPSVASIIYNHFLGDKETPVVLDPCMGFGGRMLGFYIKYPHGVYIGCEPNKETFSELCELKKKISEYLGYEIDAKLYNTTIEEFSSVYLKDYINNINLTFTSIPYYNLERYSEDIVSSNYKDFEDWKAKFINCIFSLPNCLINLPTDLYNECQEINCKVKDFYYLENTAAKHFNKKEKRKKEYIVKCF